MAFVSTHQSSGAPQFITYLCLFPAPFGDLWFLSLLLPKGEVNVIPNSEQFHHPTIKDWIQASCLSVFVTPSFLDKVTQVNKIQ